MKQEAWRADLVLLLTAAIWGAAFVAQRVGMDYVGPLTFNGVRFALAAITLLPLALRNGPAGAVRHQAKVGAGAALGGGAVAGLLLFAGASLQQIGLVYTTAGKAGFITGLYVVIVPLLGTIWRQWPGWGGWLGACLAAVGLYLLSVTEQFTLAPGDGWVLACAVVFAGHVLIVGWLAPRVHVLRLAVGQYVVCSALSLTGAALLESITLDSLLQAAIPILYGGVMSVGVGYTLQVVGQRVAPPTHAAIILSLEAVFAALAGWVFLGEVLSDRALVGCGLMLTGMVVAQLWP